MFTASFPMVKLGHLRRKKEPLHRLYLVWRALSRQGKERELVTWQEGAGLVHLPCPRTLQPPVVRKPAPLESEPPLIPLSSLNDASVLTGRKPPLESG